MKNLANCGPREFMRQTAKIRHAVEKWLKMTDIINIRKRLPKRPELSKDMPTEEKKARVEQWNKDMQTQAQANISAILDAIMDEHPDETVDLLALCCFVEPECADDYTMSEYMGAVADMVGDANVMRFFSSLVQLGRMSGFEA